MRSRLLTAFRQGKILFILVLSTCVVGNAQQPPNLTFTSWSGQQLTLGDTLTFIQGSGHNKFYQHLYLSTGEKLWQNTVPYRRGVIKNIRNVPVEGKEIMVAVMPYFPEKGFFNVWIDLEKALKTGEVVGPESQCIRFKNYKWLSNEPLIVYLKLMELEAKPFAREYLFRYYRETYDKYRNDEFEFQEKLNGVAKQMQKQMDELNFNLRLCLGFELTLGDYNFEKGGFDISLPKYFNVLTETLNDVAQTKVALTFPELKDVSIFKMTPDRAKQFIQSRKRSTGEIDRKVICKVNFRFKDKLTSVLDERIIVCLTGKVEFVEMYGNMNKYSDDLGVIEFLDSQEK